jgi:hypothetical protein
MREIGEKKSGLTVHPDRINIRNSTTCDALGNALSGNKATEFNPWESKFIKISW